jgi:hypothetical protein
MEYLDRVSRLKEDTNEKEVLAFLTHFLDDASLRDLDSERYRHRGCPAGFTSRQLEVRNFAALRLAEILDLSLAAEEWADFRAQVRRALPR